MHWRRHIGCSWNIGECKTCFRIRTLALVFSCHTLASSEMCSSVFSRTLQIFFFSAAKVKEGFRRTTIKYCPVNSDYWKIMKIPRVLLLCQIMYCLVQQWEGPHLCLLLWPWWCWHCQFSEPCCEHFSAVLVTSLTLCTKFLFSWL